MTIGEKIKQRRMELGWSQRDLAAKMGYNHHSTVARIESGKVDIPQSRIVKFSEVLGVTITYLMDWEEVQKKNNVTADIVVRLRTDEDFLSLNEGLMQLDPEQLASVKQIVDVLLKG
jgi:transcriptional regulator with XRE-family HTH domain